MMPFFVLLALLCTVLINEVHASQDPCRDVGSVEKGGPFTVGIAILPDSNVQSWRSPLGPYFHPCRNKQMLSRAVVSVYTIQTDRITVLRSQREAQEFFFDSIVANVSSTLALNTNTNTNNIGGAGMYGSYGVVPAPAPGANIAPTVGSSMTAVVFHGTQFPVMSDPFVIRSTNPLIGVGRVPRLTLMVRLSKGKTVSMRWDIRDGKFVCFLLT